MGGWIPRVRTQDFVTSVVVRPDAGQRRAPSNEGRVHMPLGSRVQFLSLPLSLGVCGVLHAQGGHVPETAPAFSPEETDGLVARVRRQEYRFEAVNGEHGTWSAPNRMVQRPGQRAHRGEAVEDRAALPLFDPIRGVSF